ncbi:TolC family outer membrane protein [Sphingomonas sp.]|uniref:TolC family outer membrane protein n=1 Tax=Sphingomonas sp. TaxID=28214 RepID=UPI0037522EBC
MTRPIATALALLAFAAAPASADSLREALVSTYNANPTITAQRASLRATDSTVAIARAAGRPSVVGTASLGRDLTQVGTLQRVSKGPFLNSGVNLSVPLYSGGSVRNSVKAAKTRVDAGRATLRAVEGDVFVDAVTAYMDVIRDRAIVELNQNNVRVLSTNFEATGNRFKIGDLTRTDVAQSEARLSLVQSSLATAQGRLTVSEENYRRVIGKAPGALQPPPPLPPLPVSADQAVQIALLGNPDLISVLRQAEAAGIDVRTARAGRLPTLSGVAAASYVRDFSGVAGFNPNTGQSSALFGSSTSIGVQGRVPFYQGGLPAARIRQAQAIEGQLLEQTVGTERAVVATTRSAFATYQSALGAITANQTAVSANTLALEGARAERTVGTRTVLDVLNAEQELLNSQVQLVTARRDAYVAGFQLLNAMGQAQADTLGLDGGPLYDPLGNYRHVAHNANDWANDRNPTAVATRTVVPAEMPTPATPVNPVGMTGPNQ